MNLQVKTLFGLVLTASCLTLVSCNAEQTSMTVPFVTADKEAAEILYGPKNPDEFLGYIYSDRELHDQSNYGILSAEGIDDIKFTLDMSGTKKFVLQNPCSIFPHKDLSLNLKVYDYDNELLFEVVRVVDFRKACGF